MVMDVHFGNTTNDALDNGDKVRKPFFELCDRINAVLAFNIIAPADVRLILVVFQDAGHHIIAVTVPELKY